jgi:hypothetical protein
MAAIDQFDRDDSAELLNEGDISREFDRIRLDVRLADSRLALTDLYKRAEYLASRVYSSSLATHDHRAEQLRLAARDEFRLTSRAINKRAEQIGAEPNYIETCPATD